MHKKILLFLGEWVKKPPKNNLYSSESGKQHRKKIRGMIKNELHFALHRFFARLRSVDLNIKMKNLNAKVIFLLDYK
jgi:hypothetical protein